MALFLSPVSATQHTYPVHYVVDGGQVVPYIDIGTGHTGTWKIWGWIRDYYSGTYKYVDSGHVLPIFSRYWGYGKSVKNLRDAAFDSYADF
jgi:hypothetical protein